jgi:RNA polymerase sigma factor (sigma-70 family)
MQILRTPRLFCDYLSTKRTSIYYVDFNQLGIQRVPNRFERDLQKRLIHYDVDQIDFKRLLEVLNHRDRSIVEAFYMGYTQQEIADRFGLAQQTVSRLLRQVGRRLERMVRGLPWRGDYAILPLEEARLGNENFSRRNQDVGKSD